MLEIIASSFLDAKEAKAGGADRLELVSALSEGGFSPTIALFMRIKEEHHMDVAVMVRPNKKEFYYDREDLLTMKEEVKMLQDYGCDHVVLGMLDEEGLPDLKALELVLGNFKGKVTFHRAIDASKDVLESLQVLENYSRVTHILTSGGEGSCMEHLGTIKEMISLTSKRIIVGSGVNLENIPLIKVALKGLDYDLHLGSAVRESDVLSPVEAKKVQDVKNIINNM